MPNDIELQIRKRAGDVRQGGAYCGLFELTVWAALKEWRVLCSFGASIVNARQFCGKWLPSFRSRATIRVVAVQCTADGLFSADKPGQSAPEANHFVAAYEQHKGSAKSKTDESVRSYRKGGGRRSAEEVAYDLGWQLELTDAMGDCLIDAFSFHAHRVRNPITWKRIRNELGDKMEHIVDMVAKEGVDSPWAACFRLCGEDDLAQRLPSTPFEPKGEISGWGTTGPTLQGSSLCGLKPADLAASSGDPVTAVPGATGIAASVGSPVKGITPEDVKKHTLDCLTLQAGSLAALLQEAAAL